MADYTPPTIKNLPFSFSGSGYSAPDFDKMSVNFTSRSMQTQSADLQAAINVMQLYRDSTHTYLKECKTVIIGYSQNGIQTLKLPCLYGGLRDLGVTLTGLPPNSDLVAYVFAIMNFKDLRLFARAALRETTDLPSWVRANAREQYDVYSFIRPTTKASRGISAYTKIMLGTEIPYDLLTYIADIQPKELSALLNVIELRNLQVDIQGVWLNSNKDLQGEIYKIYTRSEKTFLASLHGYQTLDLLARITSFWKKDLRAEINAGFFEVHGNLISYINSITPRDILSYIHGYDTREFSVKIYAGFGPYDIRAYLNVGMPDYLYAHITGYYEVAASRNLTAYVRGNFTQDLGAYISTITYKALAAYITAAGNFLDLPAYIVPKTINIKRILYIPLFEHKDLSATINYNCMLSGYKDLGASFYLLYKNDLKAYIIGWHSGTADNVKDLGAYINVSDYTVFNTYNINGVPQYPRGVIHDISGGKTKNYKLFDTYTLAGGSVISNLRAYVTGVLESKTLSAKITAAPLANYTSVPSWVKPKTREVVINLDRFEQRWRRFVDLMFFTNSDRDYHYFYVSGANKVYKMDRDRTWVIWVTGYDYNSENMYDRVKVRRKFIFNLSKYNTVDEAVRDMIDRVSELRSRDLSAFVTSILGNYENLPASINGLYKQTWVKHLRAQLKCLSVGYTDLSGQITPLWLEDHNNLSASILGKSYEPPAPDGVTFTFKDAGFSAPTPYVNINWTRTQAEEFWKDDEE